MAAKKKSAAKKRKAQKKVARVMHEWKAGGLHSGSKTGPVVKSHDQAVAIALSEVGLSNKKRKKRKKKK